MSDAMDEDDPSTHPLDLLYISTTSDGDGDFQPNRVLFSGVPFASCFRRLDEQRRNRLFCDVILVAGKGAQRVEIAAHKNVLASASPYFERMFSDGFSESKQKEVEIKDVTGAALSALVDYIYTGRAEIAIDSSLVRDLLHASVLMLIDHIKEVCGRFLSERITDDSLVSLLELATRYSCRSLVRGLDDYATFSFARLSASGVLREVDAETLTRIISADELRGGEKLVYTTVLDWVRADPDTRSDALPSLLAHVRLPLLGTLFVVEVVGNEPLITANPACSEIYINALKFCAASSLDDTVAERYGSASWTNVRNPFNFPVAKRQWMHAGKLTHKRKECGLSVLGEKIFAVGGSNGNEDLASCETFPVYPDDLKLSVADLPQPLGAVGVCQVREKLYANGRRIELRGESNVVLDYDTAKDTWTTGPQMRDERSVSIAAVEGCIYVAGSPYHERPTRMAEMWDPRTAAWQSIGDLCAVRSWCSLAAVGDDLYALCGDGDTDVMEVYDRRANAWRETHVPNLNRAGAAVTVYDEKLIVSGGLVNGASTFHEDVKILINNQWVDISGAELGKNAYHGMVEMDGCIFISGGYMDRSLTDDVGCMPIGGMI